METMTTDREMTMAAAMEITYTEKDGLLYPDLELPEQEGGEKIQARLNRYGRMAVNYLKEEEPARYRMLIHLGRLEEKMNQVEEEAHQMLETLMEAYLKKNPPKDRESTMEMWQLREQAKQMAEEIVLKEVVLKFH